MHMLYNSDIYNLFNEKKKYEFILTNNHNPFICENVHIFKEKYKINGNEDELLCLYTTKHYEYMLAFMQNVLLLLNINE